MRWRRSPTISWSPTIISCGEEAETSDSGLGGSRLITPGKRAKYGYVNPPKTSPAGLEILTKGLDTRRSIAYKVGDEFSKSFHLTRARYICERRGQLIKFKDAILGHKDPGASGHWNSEGHMHHREDNKS